VIDDDAAVSVVGVLAQADIRHHGHAGDVALDGFDRRLHRTGGIPRRRADAVLPLRKSEQEHGAHAGVPRPLRLFDRFAHAELEDSGHGADLGPRAARRDDEERIDEILGADDGLAHEGADGVGAAEAPRAADEVRGAGRRNVSRRRQGFRRHRFLP
jgi:hypothetical protein